MLDSMQPSSTRMPMRRRPAVADKDRTGVGGEQVEHGLRDRQLAAVGLVAGAQRDVVGGAGRQRGHGGRHQFRATLAIELQQPHADRGHRAGGAGAGVDGHVLAVHGQEAPDVLGLVEGGGELAARHEHSLVDRQGSGDKAARQQRRR
jgi:hypothetical protein